MVQVWGTPIFAPLPFGGDSIEMKKEAGELGLTMHNTSYSQTLTIHRPPKPNKEKRKKFAKSNYVIGAGLIWVRNRSPGSNTRVACHEWTVHGGAGNPQLKSRGPPFLDHALSEEKTIKGARELGSS